MACESVVQITDEAFCLKLIRLEARVDDFLQLTNAFDALGPKAQPKSTPMELWNRAVVCCAPEGIQLAIRSFGVRAYIALGAHMWLNHPLRLLVVAIIIHPVSVRNRLNRPSSVLFSSSLLTVSLPSLQLSTGVSVQSKINRY